MSLDQDKNRHYSLRKLSVGLVSVLIGISFISAKGQVVKADNVKDNAKSAINEQALKPEKQDMQASILKGTSNSVKQNVENVDMTGIQEKTPPVQNSVKQENRSENSNSSLNPNDVSSLNKNTQITQNDVPRENRAEVTSDQTATTQPTNTQDQTVITQPQGKQQTSSDQNSVAKSQKNLLDDLGKQKTFTQAGNQVEDNVQTQLQNRQKLDLTKNRQLAKKVLATNLIETNSLAMTNGGFDSSWGTLDVNDWKGFNYGDYYVLTHYVADNSDDAHIVVPNEADFEKAGISTGGKQVAVTKDFFKNIQNHSNTSAGSTRSLAFSKTAGKQVKAIGNDWTDAFPNYGFSKFNGENLDVSEVTSMHDMFENCSNLSDISSLAHWDTSNVTNMDGMFGNCNNLSDISSLDNWDTSKVTYMSSMFNGCESLSDISPLAHWDMSNVTNMDVMFNGCESLSDISPLAHWDTSKVTSMVRMFNGCESLSDISPLAHWDTSKVTSMVRMFNGCESLSDISPLAQWDTSKVNTMSGMFEDTPLKKVTLTNWDFSNINRSYGFKSIFPDTNYEATLSDKTSKSLLDVSSKLLDSAKENLKRIDSAPIVDGVPDVDGRIQQYLDTIKQGKEEYQQQLDYYKQQIDHYKKELADPNTDAATKEKNQSELKQTEQEYQYYLTGDGKKEYDGQIQDLQEQFKQYKQEIQQEINQIKLQAEYPLDLVFGNHSKITTPNQDLLVYLVGKSPVRSDATRTIEITFPDGTKKTINQSIGYGKYAISGTADMATHKLDMAMPYELSKWELIKKEDGSYDLVKAHVDKNGVASFDAVQLPKIPGYKAKISRIPSGNSAQPAMFLVSFVALPSVHPGAQHTPDDTKRDQGAVINTKQDQDAVINTKQDQDAVINTKQDQDTVINTKHLNTANMQVVSNQPVLLENADNSVQMLNTANNLQSLNTDTNTSIWQIENSVEDKLIAPYVVFNSNYKLDLPRFNNYNLQIIKRTSNKDDLSFVYLDQDKTFKYVFNIKIEDGKYLLSISQIENKRFIPVKQMSFSDYHQLIELI